MTPKGYDYYPLPVYRVLRFYVVLICGCVLVGVAIWQSSPDFHADSTCDQNYAGNSDMYGIGVRLATYIQVVIFSLSVHLAYTPETLASLAMVNNWFLVAYIMAFMVMLRDPATEPLVLYVVVLQGNGLTSTMMLPPRIAIGKRRARAHNIETVGGLIFRSVIIGTWRACTTYFWWALVPLRLTPANTESCTQWGYLVVRVALVNGSPLHIVHMVLNAVNCIRIITMMLSLKIFALYMLGRLLLFSLGSTPKAPAFFKPIQSHPNRPTIFRLLLDVLFVFTVGELIMIIFGGISLPVTHTHVENSTNCVVRCIDGPKKHECDKISCDHQLIVKYAQDADIVDRRLANFMIEKYNLTSVPALPSSRRLTFQWVLLLMIGPDFKNERDTWRRWIKYFDPHEYLLLRLAVLTCFQIIPVEFTIRVNNVQGVNDVFQPGQILALVASLGGMLSLGMALCIQKSTSGSNAGKKLYIYMPLDEDAEATEVCRMRDIEQGVTAKKEAAGQEGSTQTGGGVVVTTILEEDRK